MLHIYRAFYVDAAMLQPDLGVFVGGMGKPVIFLHQTNI